MRSLATLFIIVLCLSSCSDEYTWHALEVKASAYNSLHSQTDGDPNIAAWGDTLVPGEKSIAVSRDLIKKGLRHNTPVKIHGLEGIYLVKDKMHERMRNRIDIYMGIDKKEAMAWGNRKIKIEYGVLKEE